MPKYLMLNELLELCDDPQRGQCLSFLETESPRLEKTRGSTHNHQAWPGGYLDHITEVLNIAVQLYGTMNDLRTLPFSLHDALVVLFLHDVEKPWRFEREPNGAYRNKENLQSKDAHQEFRLKVIREHGIIIDDKQARALKYVEGEISDYSSTHRVMSPLAAFCHLCDVTSARIWFDQPSGNEDMWSGNYGSRGE